MNVIFFPRLAANDAVYSPSAPGVARRVAA